MTMCALFMNGTACDWYLYQPHLLSVSENINEVEFHPKEYERILSVISKEGEKIMVSYFMRIFSKILYLKVHTSAPLLSCS